MSINGVSQGEVAFTAPDNSTFMEKPLTVSLEAGTNTITFTPSWGWMSFDYIDVLGAVEPSAIGNIESEQALQIEDNGATFSVSFEAVSVKNAIVQLCSIDGSVIQRISGLTIEGNNTIEISKAELSSGIYVIQLITEEGIISDKVIIE